MVAAVSRALRINIDGDAVKKAEAVKTSGTGRFAFIANAVHWLDILPGKSGSKQLLQRPLAVGDC